MKILHILNTSLPKLAGYSTRSYHLIKNQKKMGIHPVVLTSERYGYCEVEVEVIDEIKHYRTRVSDKFIRKIPILAEIDEIHRLSKNVSKIALKEKIDLIHAHSPSILGAACIEFCIKNKIPFVYEIRAFWEDAAVDRGAFGEDSLKYKLRRMHETKVVNKSNAVVAICNGIKDDLLRRGCNEEHIHIVKNGVDHLKFQPLTPNSEMRKKLGLDDKFVLGFIGSFFYFEGIQDLIYAMKKLCSANSNFMLLLVGKGQMELELKDMVKELKIENNILFLGQVPHDHIDKYYAMIDLLVYPRIKKRITDLVTPIKPLEAMAMEKPILMSDVGGLRELAESDDVCSFFKAGDIDDLAAKCMSLYKDEKKRTEIGKNARKVVVNNWGWSERAKKSIAIYKKLLNVK